MNDEPEGEVRTSAKLALQMAQFRRVFAVTGMLALIVGTACLAGVKH
jgi:hypothetical protein